MGLLESYKSLCVPSQNGSVSLMRQPHSQAVSVFSATKAIGSTPLPSCEPSHQGWVLLLPQAQYQYSLPSSTWTSYGSFCNFYLLELNNLSLTAHRRLCQGGEAGTICHKWQPHGKRKPHASLLDRHAQHGGSLFFQVSHLYLRTQ